MTNVTTTFGLSLADSIISITTFTCAVLYFLKLFFNGSYLVETVRRHFRVSIPLSLFLPLGSLIRGFENLHIYNLTPIFDKVTYYFNVFGVSMMLFATAACIIDRLISTILWKKYFKMKYSFLIGPVLVLISVAVSILIAITYDEESMAERVFILWILHLLFGILTLLLLQRNKKLRVTIRASGKLNYNYQVVENLRVLVIIAPHLAVVTLIASIAPLSLIICPRIGVSFHLAIEIFYLIYNASLMLCMIMAVYRNYIVLWKTRRKVIAVQNEGKFIQGPLGVQIKAKDNIDDHFKSLQATWDKVTVTPTMPIDPKRKATCKS